MNSLRQKINEGMHLHQNNKLPQAKQVYQRLLTSQPDHPELLNLLGNVQQDLGEFDAAIANYNIALQHAPHYAEAYANRADALQELKEFKLAIDSYAQAIRLEPNNPDNYYNQGVAFSALELFSNALDCYVAAIKLDPNCAEFHFNHGNTLKNLNLFDQAITSYNQAILLKPKYAEAYLNRAAALQSLKQFDHAIDSLQQAIQIKPDYVEAYLNLSSVLIELEQYDIAQKKLMTAIQLDSGHPKVNLNLGVCFHKLKQVNVAIAYFNKAIALNPSYPEAYLQLGTCLHGQRNFDVAIQCYQMAIQLKPNYPEAYLNYSATLFEINIDLENALSKCNTAIAQRNDYADAYLNKSVILDALGQSADALHYVDVAITLKDNFIDAHFHKSLFVLAAENFSLGFELYKWRWQTERYGFHNGQYRKDWNGTDSIQSLIVLSEQGLGDIIFYIGMLYDLSKKVQHLTLATDIRLILLLERSFPNVLFIDQESIATGHSFDHQAYLGDLGQYLRSDPNSFNTIKTQYLTACHTRTKQIRQAITSNRKLICGLSWSSNNKRIGFQKSLALEDLLPLFEVADVEFVDLQYGDTNNERSQLLNDYGHHLHKVESVDNFNDIDGLAALINACDIVVTISNTTAHLAAALGKPTFVVLPYAKGLLWYWHLNRADSPWYPSVKLYRQISPNDWTSVIKSVQSELSHRAQLYNS